MKVVVEVVFKKFDKHLDVFAFVLQIFLSAYRWVQCLSAVDHETVIDQVVKNGVVKVGSHR